ncbi:MAG: baseplate J/gp47 family protein [Candidatus Cloacimonetes bacterium]|nr:baseplate J/gp47 family protein [Candidatus Cloacimonadota bacterium]
MAIINDLPEVLFAKVDTKEVEQAIITMYEGITNTTLFPGDPVRLFLSTLAADRAQENAITDWMNKQNLLRYATGNFLDHLGYWGDVQRLPASPSKTTLLFTQQEERAIPTIIPKGTRATADGKVFFATDVATTIPAGDYQAEVSATCLSTGTVSNGLVAGQVNRLVDRIAFIEKVINTSTTQGGSDIENDESLRKRIRLAPERFTTAGSELAYIYYALTAHSNIEDVAILSPKPVWVELYIMLKGGEIPDPEGAEITAVKDIFGVHDGTSTNSTMSNTMSGKKIRPLTDFVQVYPINAVDIDYTVRWYVTSEQAVDLKTIQENIANAVTEYEVWQKAKAGRDIVPDKLISLCRSAGAKRVQLTGLEFIRLSSNQVANFLPNADRIEFGGVEAE